MNPSGKGWIKKLLKQLDKQPLWNHHSADEFYDQVRDSGFIYGSNMSVIKGYIDHESLTEEEICKINFILAFKYIYDESLNTEVSFVESIIHFYQDIDAHKPNFFNELLGELKSHALLEFIIHKRVLIEDNFIEKSFTYFITNALLFTDILAYKRYLKNHKISQTYLQHLESVIESVVVKVLDAKNQKTKYDKSLVDLFKKSLRYQNHPVVTYETAITSLDDTLEAYYIMDLACMATWTDLTLDRKEHDILKSLTRDLKLDTARLDASIQAIEAFFSSHKNNIALLSSKNIVQTFYSKSSRMVSVLIKRNSKRLMKEISQSKDLMWLLTQSTVRELTEQEQKRVQLQLMDIFKSIPSLAILILPGGSLLLPLVVKFIPKLLPSAFDDNRIEED